MNLLHMKYAVEIARTGSISKASETLYVAQPNLSRSVKELEADLGICIFDRSSKGMMLTPKGEIFIRYAEKVLNQVDEIEKMCRGGMGEKKRFSVSVPRASYISDAFALFSRNIGADPTEMFYMETNPSKAISNIINSDYNLGILRFAEKHERHFTDYLEEKGLTYELIVRFRYVIITSRDNPLAKKNRVSLSELTPFVEISHGDPYVPSLPSSELIKEENPAESMRRIFIFERGGQFDLLMENPETFMWVSPLPQKILDRYNLAQLDCGDDTRYYKDVLIRKKDYKLSKLDNLFISELVESKRRCFG